MHSPGPVLSFPVLMSSLHLPTKSSQGAKELHSEELARKSAKVTAKVKRLLYKDVDRGVQTTIDAFKDDPLHNFVTNTPDAKKPFPGQKILNKAIYSYFVAHSIRRKITLTINEGDAVVVASYPPSSEHGKPGHIERVLDLFFGVISGAVEGLSSPQQKKRKQELRAKATALNESTLGDRAKDMYYIDVPGTAPASQGQGYGGMLVDAITALADKDGRATYLLSSNINNTYFYNSHGFITVGQVVLGDDDPTWDRPPLIVPLMVRRAVKTAEEKSEDSALNQKV